MPVLQGCFKSTSYFGLTHEAETVVYYNLRAFVHNYFNATTYRTWAVVKSIPQQSSFIMLKFQRNRTKPELNGLSNGDLHTNLLS